MKAFIKPYLLICTLLLVISSRAQQPVSNACKLENGKLKIRVDVRWSKLQRDSASQLFGIDSMLLVQLASATKLKNDSWKIKRLNDFEFEISKHAAKKAKDNFKKHDVFIVDSDWFDIPSPPSNWFVFGVNNLLKPEVFSYKDGKATFYLPGFLETGEVVLAGSFNNWSTSELPMKKTDTGWMVAINLKPGRYTYKYIVDGRWMPDPNNPQVENHGNYDENSIVFCNNYMFHLNEFTNAHKVVLAGSFNNWNEHDYTLGKTEEGWKLAVWLSEGSHTYKYIVDGQWMIDPQNPRTVTDAQGNQNSLLGIGDSLVFKLNNHLHSKQVALAGSFNAWNPNELFLDRTVSGWRIPYVLAAGNYEYKFVVDGEWITDPENPFTNGSGETTNSFVSFKPNYAFKLSGFGNAKSVGVSGNFNNWGSYSLLKRNGDWVLPIYLQPGKITYKFIVDGEWMIDPGNPLWEENEYDTGNSVVWIEP